MTLDLDDYFSPSNSMQCNKCGELIVCDYDLMEEHLSDEHNIEEQE